MPKFPCATLDSVNLQVKPSYEDISREAARLVADAIRGRPDITLALPTGRTPLGMYGELVKLHRQHRLGFSGVRIFSLDEYAGLPESDPHTFRNYLWTNFLSHIDVRSGNVILAPCSGGAPADLYEERIKAAGGIDLLIAGLGTNGHIAFNEPGSPFDSRTRLVNLTDSTMAAIRYAFEEGVLPRQAVTVGIATILEARSILLLAAGKSKKEVLDRVLHGPVTEAVPASALRLHGAVTIVADEAAAI